ncbi:MAG: DUF3667 domain-containing protein [Gammaproteobacteria bacterium]
MAGDDQVTRANGPKTCANCGATLYGSYCSECGQGEHSLYVPLPRLILDFLSDQFQFDARIWRTLRLLLFHPGRLTAEYISGKRQRYIPPVRLYLFISIVLFLTLELLPAKFILFGVPSDQFQTAAPRAAMQSGAAGSAAQRGSRTPSPGSATNLRAAVKAGIQEAKRGQSPKVAKSTSEFETWLVTHDQAARAEPAQFRREFWSNVPKVLFFLIPVFALLLKLLYLLRRRYYSEHLVFALHYHSVVFLSALVIVLLSAGARSAPALLAGIMHWSAVLLTIWTGLYIIPALHTAYTDSWPRAFGRGMVLMFLYLVAVFLGTVGAVAVTLAMA